MAVERLQAPAGGMNSEASPDYVPASHAPLLQNLLPGKPGKLVMRGSLTSGLNINGSTSNPVQAFWTFDDVGLLVSDDGVSVKAWRLTSNFTVKTDVTATLTYIPQASRHVRFGDYVYSTRGTSASLGVTEALVRWDGGATALGIMTDGPRFGVDLRSYAKRLFVLGGTVPGTTTPVINSARVLYWTDPGITADLSLVGSWTDDTSGLVNQLLYDGDDTPVALASCGRYLAIIGSRSVNVLSGSGTSSFTIKNLSKNLGCTNAESVVEVDDGFYFMSDRGLVFCDGSSVTLVSDAVRNSVADSTTNWTAVFGHGFLALAQTGRTWLYDISTRTWSQITSGCFPATYPYSVHRSLNHALIWDGRAIWLANSITTWASGGGNDSGAGISATAIPARLKTRVARLAAPTSVATLERVIVDSTLGNSAGTWAVNVRDGHDTSLDTGVAAGQASGVSRNRAQFEAFAETSTAYLDITYAPTGTPTLSVAELYDCWLEFKPGRNEPGF